MHIENLSPSLQVWEVNLNYPVKPARSNQGAVQQILSVRRCHDYDIAICTKTIHLHQNLIQCIVPLIM